MSRDQVLHGAKEIMRRTGLTYSQLAVLAGVSPSTTRTMILSGIVPERAPTWNALSRFIELNINAKSKADLKMG